MTLEQLETRQEIVEAICETCAEIIDRYDSDLYGDLPELAKWTLEDARNALADGCKDYDDDDIFYPAFYENLRALEKMAKGFRIRNHAALPILREKMENAFF